jgi:hypothetical protein
MMARQMATSAMVKAATEALGFGLWALGEKERKAKTWRFNHGIHGIHGKNTGVKPQRDAEGRRGRPDLFNRKERKERKGKTRDFNSKTRALKP